MEIGLLREIKIKEGRVALTPDAVGSLVSAGHRVHVEKDAGSLAGFEDSDYSAEGAIVGLSQREVWSGSELIIKVKEPIKKEYKFIESKHTIFSYLHLAAEPDLIDRLLETKCRAIALENIEMNGRLPGLDPMSIIAGRIAANLAFSGLFHSNGGSGILLGGALGTPTGFGVVVGGGVSGMAAAEEMLKHSMDVIVYDINPEVITKVNRMNPKSSRMGGTIIAKQSLPNCIANSLEIADVVIGAVLVPGLTAPKVITKEMVEGMRRGSVIVDIAIDQGGCVEGIEYTNWDKQSYTYGDTGVKVFAIPNLPGAVPRTSSLMVSEVILPHALNIARGEKSEALRLATSIEDGLIKDIRLLPKDTPIYTS